MLPKLQISQFAQRCAFGGFFFGLVAFWRGWLVLFGVGGRGVAFCSFVFGVCARFCLFECNNSELCYKFCHSWWSICIQYVRARTKLPTATLSGARYRPSLHGSTHFHGIALSMQLWLIFFRRPHTGVPTVTRIILQTRSDIWKFYFLRSTER